MYPSVDKLLTLVDSKYKLVHIVSQRSNELKIDKNYQLKESDYISKRDIGRALEEIIEGKLIIKNI